jgi:excisionase family DNA binding protein
MPSTVSRLRPRLITTQEAASLLRVTPRTIVNWIERGSIPYLELPSGGVRKEYRIPEVALLRSLSGNFDLEAELERLEATASGRSEEELVDALGDD